MIHTCTVHVLTPVTSLSASLCKLYWQGGYSTGGLCCEMSGVTLGLTDFVDMVLNNMWHVEAVLDKGLDCGMMWHVEAVLDKGLDCGMQQIDSSFVTFIMLIDCS